MSYKYNVTLTLQGKRKPVTINKEVEANTKILANSTALKDCNKMTVLRVSSERI